MTLDLHKANKMLEVIRSKLPSFGMREEILELIKSNNIVVISGETGYVPTFFEVIRIFAE